MWGTDEGCLSFIAAGGSPRASARGYHPRQNSAPRLDRADKGGMGLLDKPVHREVNGAGASDVVDESALAAFGCDVAFVGDDATPAEALVAAAVEQTAELHLKHVLRDVFDRLRGQYESGGM